MLGRRVTGAEPLASFGVLTPPPSWQSTISSYPTPTSHGVTSHTQTLTAKQLSRIDFTMTIGIAIIGSGIFAKEAHLPAVLATPELSLKAIYSRSLASAKSLSENLDNVELYSEDAGEGKSYADLLKRDDTNAVIIALPIPNQPAYIKQALSAGKHVLAEKPMAKDIATAVELLEWYRTHVDTANVTFGIAENIRFLDSFVHAAEQVKRLGRVFGFRTRLGTMVKPGSKYFETAWRKTPGYQGGFLLDGGVHLVAGTRLLLPSTDTPVRLSAYSALLQEYLPPVDTLEATWKTGSGVSGSFSVSFGTTFTGLELDVACEQGTVSATMGKVTVTKDGKEEVTEFKDDSSGVMPEVKAWAEGLVAGKPNPRQSPEEALADLEILEAMLKSGEQNGAPIDLKYSI